MAQSKTLSFPLHSSSDPNPNPTFSAAHFPPASFLPSLLPPCVDDDFGHDHLFTDLFRTNGVESTCRVSPWVLPPPNLLFFFSIFFNLWFLIRILLRLLIRIIPVISFILLLRTDSSDNARRPGRAHSFCAAAASKFRRSRPKGAMPVPQGHIPIYVGDEIERFSVSAELLNHPVFVTLLEKSAHEYGYEQKGVLRILCHVLVFARVLEAIRIGDQDSLDLQDLLFFFFCLFRFLSLFYLFSLLCFSCSVWDRHFFFLLSSFFRLLCFLLSEQEIRVVGREGVEEAEIYVGWL